MPLNAYWIALTEMVWSSLHFTAASLPLNVVFILSLLLLYNAAIGRLAPSWRLSPSDLLIVYVVLASASAISGYDSLIGLIGVLPHAAWFATPANDWNGLFGGHLPEGFLLTDRDAVRAFYAGGAFFFSEGYWRAWMAPWLRWGLWMLALATFSLCVTVLLRRPWTEQEKLSYPIIQLPIELSRRETVLFRGSLFWVGFALAGLVDLLNGLNYLYPSLPSVPVRGIQLERYLTERPWNAIGWTPVRFRFFMIGMTYLLPLDLSVSCWVFYWVRKAEQIVGSAMGWHRLPGYPFPGQQAIGGLIGLGLLALVGMRRHLATAVRAAVWNDGREVDRGEPISYRAVAIGGIVSGLAMFLLSLQLGLAPWASLIFATIFWAMYIGMTRIRAEAGVPEHDLHLASPQETLVALLGTRRLGPRNLSGLSLFVWFSRRKRNYLMPHQLEAFKIAERSGLPARGVFATLLLASAMGLIAALLIFPAVLYRYGAESRAYGMKEVGESTFSQLAGWIQYPRDPDLLASSFFFGGMGFTALLMFLRHRFVWWPLHPAGYVLGTGFGVEDYWFAMVLSSTCKWLVLRHGGVRAYRRSLPFFFGLILGDYLLACGWALLGVVLDRPMYTVWL
ncbi:MAG: hypothetical protein KatS3mg115_0647 [Candidatus Poribacteria bacterium]|nr:MAG: hypothetical protein KatS3mg115_0647 [Candidatus Poribacteria bacterium]